MKRGIIVVHDGHESEEIQKGFLSKHTESIVSIKPMTSEDWYYQLQDACSSLGQGDEVHVMHMHYLGDSMSRMAHAIDEMTTRGIRVYISGECADDNGIASTAALFVAAEADAAKARLHQLQQVAASRRNATPPKCILVDPTLLEQE